MRVPVPCANSSGTSLVTMWSVEKAMKELGVPITKTHHCAISEGKNSASQYDVVFTSVNFSQMFQQAGKCEVTVMGIKNAMFVKEIQGKYMVSDRYQKSE